MNKKIFLSYIKSLTFLNKNKFGNNFGSKSSRNFVLSIKNNQRNSYQRELFKHEKFLAKGRKYLLNEKVQKKEHKEHKDLKSFLSIKDMNTESYVYKGTLYEYETITCLQKNFGIIAERVGGANDSGIDFRGSWKLPNGQKLNLLGQCKNNSTKCPPSTVRELEGVLGFESKNNILGILSSKSGFSRQAIKRFIASPRPLILVSVINNGERCKIIMWNKSCEKYLDGLEVTMKFFKSEVCDGDVLETKPILLYNGKPFIPN